MVIHASDPESPRHQDALAFFVDRILPQAAVNQVATALAREGELGDDEPPQVVIQVLETDGQQPRQET